MLATSCALATRSVDLHAPRSCTDRFDALASELKSYASEWMILAKAHAVLARLLTLKVCIYRYAAILETPNKNRSVRPTAAKAHITLVSSKTLNSLTRHSAVITKTANNSTCD
eukprot:gnl/TRDRNA2_/TRDRNA2_99975_c0_seq1.p1 gnl/TRDRNA2_/TRDRNA2_99975_c0~~gnl/TRDRNA2_/TRDRNA2_99975_c0_seq1.p1  ORF type:complete len:113 (-),score=1.24 gnl/TRDRNA2_/TRDRNA2_99975_c0_seq1:98-436(-)